MRGDGRPGVLLSSVILSTISSARAAKVLNSVANGKVSNWAEATKGRPAVKVEEDEGNVGDDKGGSRVGRRWNWCFCGEKQN